MEKIKMVLERLNNIQNSGRTYQEMVIGLLLLIVEVQVEIYAHLLVKDAKNGQQ